MEDAIYHLISSFLDRGKAFFWGTLDSLTTVLEFPPPFIARHGDGFHCEFAFARALGGADPVTFGLQHNRHGEQVYDLYWARREEVLAPDNRKVFIAAGDGWEDFLCQYSLHVGDTVLIDMVSPEILEVHDFPCDAPFIDVSNTAEDSAAQNSASS